MSAERIMVQTTVLAPVERAWKVYTTPEDIMKWNAASEDWHCPKAQVDLREGGEFSSRMEAKDGSMGFDFAGTYTKVEPNKQIDYAFGDRTASVTFQPDGNSTIVRVSFEPENEYPLEYQKGGWQAILENYAKHAAV
ncbi:MAG: SRPBCC family protein [Paracoccaceae bacterium]